MLSKQSIAKTDFQDAVSEFFQSCNGGSMYGKPSVTGERPVRGSGHSLRGAPRSGEIEEEKVP